MVFPFSGADWKGLACVWPQVSRPMWAHQLGPQRGLAHLRPISWCSLATHANVSSFFPGRKIYSFIYQTSHSASFLLPSRCEENIPLYWLLIEHVHEHFSFSSMNDSWSRSKSTCTAASMAPSSETATVSEKNSTFVPGPTLSGATSSRTTTNSSIRSTSGAPIETSYDRMSFRKTFVSGADFIVASKPEPILANLSLISWVWRLARRHRWKITDDSWRKRSVITRKRSATPRPSVPLSKRFPQLLPPAHPCTGHQERTDRRDRLRGRPLPRWCPSTRLLTTRPFCPHLPCRVGRPRTATTWKRWRKNSQTSRRH